MRKWISYINWNRRREYMQDYYRRNKDRINDRVTQYCKDHDEHRRQRRKQWYQENRELQIKRVKACQWKYRIRYPDMSYYDDIINNATTDRWRAEWILKKKKAMERFKELSFQAQIRKKKMNKEKKEAKILAWIEARKKEVLDSTNISDEN